ncbi:MAG: ATP-binding protein [Candidatus Dependentiae bacterium]|nr:ATP-binding protein [Candidatus Dependentiae bacterium]
MFLKRDIEVTLKRYLNFPVVAILGPRQSGKTTLVKEYFKNHAYFSFEDPAIREFAASDPRGFLAENENEHGIILDEFQYVPEILSYIQLEVDLKTRPSYFIITGSQNFLMNQAITQSLAGRVGILTLLPFSIHELSRNKIIQKRALELIVQGSYPRAYTTALDINDLYASYIHTYVERDVRQLINVGDLLTFQKFLMLCAGRIGQLLNLSEVASQCGITAPTATKWLSVLQASYILFLLPPHFNNFNKRMVKTPKLFFYDTGVACNLLGITSTKTLSLSPFRGPLFENLIVSDLSKQFYNRGMWPSLYFWRDQNDRLEVDCIIDKGTQLIPVEIKSSETISSNFFGPMQKWNELSQTAVENNYVVYAGQMSQKRTNGRILSWDGVGNLIDKLYSGD